MTDLSLSETIIEQPRAVSIHVVLHGALLTASAAGLSLGWAGAAERGAFEPNLVLLLRFMAALKFVGVIGAALLVHWRLKRSASLQLRTAYIASVAIMALAPGLIWSLAHAGLAAGLFHAGLVGFLLLAWKDEGVSPSRRVRQTDPIGR